MSKFNNRLASIFDKPVGIKMKPPRTVPLFKDLFKNSFEKVWRVKTNLLGTWSALDHRFFERKDFFSSNVLFKGESQCYKNRFIMKFIFLFCCKVDGKLAKYWGLNRIFPSLVKYHFKALFGKVRHKQPNR